MEFQQTFPADSNRVDAKASPSGGVWSSWTKYSVYSHLREAWWGSVGSDEQHLYEHNWHIHTREDSLPEQGWIPVKSETFFKIF